MRLDWFEFSDQAEQALNSLMGTLRNGCQADLTTRLVGVPKHGSIEEKALGRARMAQTIFDVCKLGSLPERLAMKERAKLLKGFGTRSRRPGFFTDNVRDDSLDKQVRVFFSPRKPCRLDDLKAVEYANQYVSGLYQKHRFGRLSPLDLDEAAMQFHKSGLGFPVVSSDTSKYFEQVLSISRDIWNGGCDPAWIAALPALPGYRGQPLRPPHSELNPLGCAKTRFIYMMPRALANLEKTIQKPLFDQLRLQPEFSAWVSAQAVDVEMTRLLSHGKRILSVDFSRFDQSIPFEVFTKVYAIYREWFKPEAAPLIDFCEEVVKRSGIIVPLSGDSNSYEVLEGSDRTCGMPSGSVMTNMNDSHANAWVMAYAARRLKCSISAAYFQGDDAVVTFTGDPSLADLSGILSDEIGMTLSVEKSSYEVGEVTFLQNVHLDDHVVDGLNVGVRLIMHAANAMSSHERADDAEYRASDYDTIRFVQQAGYCLHHPSATEFCDWLADADCYARATLNRVRDDPAFFAKACEAVRKKDSNSQKGFSPQSLLASPVFQYMLSKVL